MGIKGFWVTTSGEWFLIRQRITVPSSSKNQAVVDGTVILQNIRNHSSSDSVTSQKALILLKCSSCIVAAHLQYLCGPDLLRGVTICRVY